MRLQPYNIIYKHVWTTVSHSRVTLVIFNGGSKSPITRKKNIGPPTIYYKNCHNRGLAHVPCMTRTPTRYPHRFIWVWCVGLDPRSAPNNWGHSKPTPGYVYGLCVPRSRSGSRNPHNYYKIGVLVCFCFGFSLEFGLVCFALWNLHCALPNPTHIYILLFIIACPFSYTHTNLY